MNKIIAVAGPTAVGKTKFAIELAKKFDGEIVSCDSMQLYKYMDIGSAKPTPEEMAQAKHHLVDFLDPRDEFSVAQYQKLAKNAISDIFSRNRIPVISGGTGLYLNSLIYEMDFSAAPQDFSYRNELMEIAEKEGGEVLHKMLEQQDKKAAELIHPNNIKKIVRALERLKQGEGTVRPFNEIKETTKDYDVLLIGLTRDRAELYDRINKRVDILIEEGLLDEVKQLMDMGLTPENISMKGIGYKEIMDYFLGKYTLEEAIDIVKKNTRHYAKKQLTWFRRYDKMNWYDISEYDGDDTAIEDIAQWLKKHIKLQNRSGKPDNIVFREHEIVSKCEEIQRQLPVFLRGFFSYLRGNVLPKTRLSYLNDIKFFCKYLINETDLTSAKDISGIKLEEFNKIKAVDINIFIDYCRRYSVEKDSEILIYENSNKTLARKKSSLSVMFKQLYRDELLDKNITDGFDPIKVPKASEREIKALQDDEVMIMLDAVSTGSHLTAKERQYWEKTKKRDKAILILFLTYGLRLFELQQLNVSSFNFNRGEFKIYRKRDKEAIMPLNQSVTEVLKDYIETERASDDNLNYDYKDALFLSLQGKRMTERQIRELVKKYTSIGLSTSRSAGYSPHKLRATAATSLIGRGNSIFDVQELLDHEQVTTTQLYASHRMNVKRDLVKDMEWELERKERK